MPDEIKKISDAEWRVMQPIWERSPRSTGELIQALAEANEWNPNTIKTLLSRLVKKDILGYTKKGNHHEYHPLVSRDDCITVEANSFLKRVFGGALEPMFTHFVEHEELTGKQIEHLQVLLEEKEKALKGGEQNPGGTG
ncbi:MAG: BlaI/MecI/CopY family transcriptional regulator [Verrucomicrobiota bacterium]